MTACLLLADVVVNGASSYSNGGGIFNYNNGTLILSHCTISNNVSQGEGGGIENEGTDDGQQHRFREQGVRER